MFHLPLVLLLHFGLDCTYVGFKLEVGAVWGGFYSCDSYSEGGCKGWLMFRAPLGSAMDLRWPSSCSSSILLAVPTYIGVRRGLSVSLGAGQNYGMLDRKAVRGR